MTFMLERQDIQDLADIEVLIFNCINLSFFDDSLTRQANVKGHFYSIYL